jgi:hypothetical protein
MSDFTNYLCIDQYLTDFMDVQVLNSAFETGLIDKLEAGSLPLHTLQAHLKTDSGGMHFMIALLSNNQVVHYDGGNVSRTESFSQALAFRSLIEVKIEFANFLAPDVMQHMSAFIRSEHEFMAKSRLFELFDYQRALESTPKNYQFTQRWVALTTALTRYEATASLAHHDFSGYQSNAGYRRQ